MSECHLHEQRDALQKQLAELESVFEGREVEFEGVVTRLKQAQRDCNEAKIEIVRLVTELKNAENQRNSMDSKVHSYMKVAITKALMKNIMYEQYPLVNSFVFGCHDY